MVAYRVNEAKSTSLTFGEVKTLVDRCAYGLLRLGVKPGEIVSIQLPNWWHFTVLSLACSRISAVPNGMSPILREREVGYMVDTVKSRFCFVPETWRGHDYARMLGSLVSELPNLEKFFVIGDSGGSGGEEFAPYFLDHHWEEECAIEELDVRRPGPNDVAQVQFTSGTSGQPKGVVHTYNTLYASYRGIVTELGLTSNDVIHAPSTLAHQTGFLNGCVMPMAEGMKVVYQDLWNPSTMLDLVDAEGVTYTSGAPTYIVDVCEVVEQSKRKTSTLRYFRSGSAAIPPGVIRRVEQSLGAQVVVSWGMTENGICTMSRKDASAQDVAASDGYALPWVELKISEVEGLTTDDGQGLLWVKSASQCVDYLSDHEAFAAAFDDDGWFNTGDLARMRDDGSLRITGRVKDMVIRGGENVPVIEVENALIEIPCVAEVAIVGIPDDRLGERACAVIVPTEAKTRIDLALLQSHLASINMAKQFWPEFVVVRNGLPRTASGKVRKAELRASVTAELIKAV